MKLAARSLAAISVAGLGITLAGCGGGSAAAPGATVTVTQTGRTTPPAATSSTPAAPPTASPTPSVPAGPAACATSALHVTAGAGNGAAGTIYYMVYFTNISGASCTLFGYPGVSLVSAGSDSGSQIGADAKRDTTIAVHTITVAPGHRAHALLGVLQPGFMTTGCTTVTAHWLKVFPPNQTAAAYVPFTIQTCAQTTAHTMRIGPVGFP